MGKKEDLNKARLGEYKDEVTGEPVIIQEAGLGTYEKVYVKKGQAFPLGTTVQESDVRGLEKITD
jgi:hypothetical protein